MDTIKIKLAEDGSSTSVTVGASGNIIIESQYNGDVEWSATDNNSVWHKIRQSSSVIKLDFDVFVRKTDKFTNGYLVVTK